MRVIVVVVVVVDVDVDDVVYVVVVHFITKNKVFFWLFFKNQKWCQRVIGCLEVPWVGPELAEEVSQSARLWRWPAGGTTATGSQAVAGVWPAGGASQRDCFQTLCS